MNENIESMVSVWCLVYNHEKYLRQCLDGLVMQKTTFPYEVIVHDDLSTDGSREIIREYEKKYPDIIKAVFEVENQWSKGSYFIDKAMLDNVNGKYVAFCEGDDYWKDPLKLQRQVDFMEKNKHVPFTYSKVELIQADGTPIGKTYPASNLITEGVITIDDYLYGEFYKGKWLFHISTLVIRRITMEGYLNFRTKIVKRYPYGDMPLAIWCFLNGDGYYFDIVTSVYRIFSGGYNSSILKDRNKMQRDICGIIDALESFDLYTCKRYKKYIDRRILRANFNLSMIDNRRTTQLRLKYIPVIKERGFSGMCAVFVKFLSPSLYRYLSYKR